MRSLVLMLFCCLVAGVLPAQETGPPVEIELQAFDADGTLIDLDWPVTSQWVWKAPARRGAFPELALRVRLQYPQGFELRPLGGAAAVQAATRTVAVDLTGPVVTVRFLLLSGDTRRVLGVTLTLTPARNRVVASPSCAAAGIGWINSRAGTPFLFLSASCRGDRRHLQIELRHSDDAHWAEPGDPKAARHCRWSSGRLLPPCDATLSLASDRDNSVSDFEPVLRRIAAAGTPLPGRRATRQPKLSEIVPASNRPGALSVEAGVTSNAFVHVESSSLAPRNSVDIDVQAQARLRARLSGPLFAQAALAASLFTVSDSGGAVGEIPWLQASAAIGWARGVAISGWPATVTLGGQALRLGGRYAFQPVWLAGPELSLGWRARAIRVRLSYAWLGNPESYQLGARGEVALSESWNLLLQLGMTRWAAGDRTNLVAFDTFGAGLRVLL